MAMHTDNLGMKGSIYHIMSTIILSVSQASLKRVILMPWPSNRLKHQQSTTPSPCCILTRREILTPSLRTTLRCNWRRTLLCVLLALFAVEMNSHLCMYVNMGVQLQRAGRNLEAVES
jgi:hypothetical protein